MTGRIVSTEKDCLKAEKPLNYDIQKLLHPDELVFVGVAGLASLILNRGPYNLKPFLLSAEKAFRLSGWQDDERPPQIKHISKLYIEYKKAHRFVHIWL